MDEFFQDKQTLLSRKR